MPVIKENASDVLGGKAVVMPADAVSSDRSRKRPEVSSPLSSTASVSKAGPPTHFCDVEGRLVATDENYTRACVFDPGAPESGWRRADPLAGKAFVEGMPLSKAEARASFPGADLDSVPAL